MIVPEYWAQARRRKRTHRQQFTVRRFGWSDDSAAAAQQHADERADEALARLVSGEKIPRREPKVPYNGADGVPIREQILERHGDTIITRNSYGARCLNTPDVLFADIDFIRAPSLTIAALIFVVGFALLATLNLALLSLPVFLAVALAAAIAGIGAFPLAGVISDLLTRLRGDLESQALERIARFSVAHRDWHLRLYRTPAGFRVLVMQQTFEARSEAVENFFRALAVDPVYARMCKVQNCFRARVSPKPWRIGIGQHIKPRPGVWPVDPRRRAQRQRWIDAYEAAAASYAACRYVKSMGSTRSVPATDAVRQVHDDLCRSDENAEIA